MGDLFPRAKFLSPGYDMDEVDEFFAAARAAYENGANAADVAAGQVRKACFQVRRRGYDIETVDGAMDRLESAFVQRERADHINVNGQEAWMELVAERATNLYPRLLRPAGERFRPPVDSPKGYDCEEVDEFLQKIIDYFDKKGTLTSHEIRNVTFSAARKRNAYDEATVDAYLARAAAVLIAVE